MKDELTEAALKLIMSGEGFASTDEAHAMNAAEWQDWCANQITDFAQQHAANEVRRRELEIAGELRKVLTNPKGPRVMGRELMPGSITDAVINGFRRYIESLEAQVKE